MKTYGKNKNVTWKEGFREKKWTIEAVKEACNQKSEDTKLNLVEFFQRRMIKCIENNGDRVIYKINYFHKIYSVFPIFVNKI